MATCIESGMLQTEKAVLTLCFSLFCCLEAGTVGWVPAFVLSVRYGTEPTTRLVAYH